MFSFYSTVNRSLVYYALFMCWQEQLWERWKQRLRLSRLSHTQCRRMTERTCSSSAPSQGSSYYPAAWILKHKASTYSLWWSSRGIHRYPVSGCTSMCWMWTTTPLFSVRIPFLLHCLKTPVLALASCPWMCLIKMMVSSEEKYNIHPTFSRCRHIFILWKQWSRCHQMKLNVAEQQWIKKHCLKKYMWGIHTITAPRSCPYRPGTGLWVSNARYSNIHMLLIKFIVLTEFTILNVFKLVWSQMHILAHIYC